MPQSIPVLLFHGQALRLINDLNEAYRSGIGRVDDLAVQLRDALTAFEKTVGTPFLDFEPVADGEPPLSEKMNRLWNDLGSDVNLLQRQLDVARAAAIFTHNLVKVELMRAGQVNARVANKLKTLQLYSRAVDSNVLTFGDFFRSEEFLDLDQVPPGQRAVLLSEGYMTLAPVGVLEQLAPSADVTVLPASNGFLGNLHELSENQGDLTFKAELDPHLDLRALVDGEPNSWIEYEHWLVDEADRLRAGNKGFAYQRVTATGGLEPVDWGSGPPGGVLRMFVEYDLHSPQPVNFISLVPFGLEDNANHPIKVAKIETSRDGTDWQPVRPENVFVGAATNLQAARAAEDVIVGEAVWAFAGRVTRYIRIALEQPQPITRRMGHIYYIDKAGQRVDVPAPLVSDPTSIYDPHRRVSGEVTQQREAFTAKRWVIGLRDITVSHFQYAEESLAVSRPLRVGGVVDRVSLEADVTIPPEYGDSEPWILFFISPDDGVSWFPINRVQDDFLGIPEILAFNDPLPEEFREIGVSYHNVPGAVTTLRLKVVLRRPADLPSTSPVLHDYHLKVRRR